MNAQGVFGWLLSYDIFLPPALIEWVRKVLRAKSFLLECQLPGASERVDPRINEDNRIYFLLEIWEAKFMRTFIQNSISLGVGAHIIWIHDAIWVPVEQQELAAQAFTLTTRQFAWTDVDFKIDDLESKRGTLIQDLLSKGKQWYAPIQRLPPARLPPTPPQEESRALRTPRVCSLHQLSLHKYLNRKKKLTLQPSIHGKASNLTHPSVINGSRQTLLRKYFGRNSQG